MSGNNRIQINMVNLWAVLAALFVGIGIAWGVMQASMENIQRDVSQNMSDIRATSENISVIREAIVSLEEKTDRNTEDVAGIAEDIAAIRQMLVAQQSEGP